MYYRTLGRTGIQVSVLAFGAGPVSGLMTGADGDAQRAVVARAIESGVNWFDTAPGYGQGQSEQSLGRALGAVPASVSCHVATKVRLSVDQLDHAAESIQRSVAESLERLGRSSITLLQLHNGITTRRDDEPASITPADILGAGGVCAAFERLRTDGLVRYFGLTGTGQPAALRAVIRSGVFDTIQIPYHLLNPTAGQVAPPGFREMNYGNVIADCAALNMGVFAIRVFAAGALLGHPPSAHTLKTPYFPLALYERDRHHAEEIAARFRGRTTMPELAVRFVHSHPSIHSAILGFGLPTHVDEAVHWAERGPLPADWLSEVSSLLEGDVVAPPSLSE